MCGISGISGKSGPKEHLENMVRVQSHRGPDAKGYYYNPDNSTGLGHNRLIIIDFNAAANQPFLSADGRYAIVFNGEIYNYLELRAELDPHFLFRTHSVLLNAFIHWGPRCLDRFNGIFAFAIWDQQQKSLFAARDRFGVKPFHYAIHQNALYFASEIKALWAAGIPKSPCASVWAGYLSYGTYGMPDETFWDGISQLPAGYHLQWQNSKISTTRWYDFVERIQSMPALAEKEVMEAWTSTALDSIRLRFRADVPVGFNISGGLDSSLLLALVHRQFPNDRHIQAFSFYTGDERYDELPWVREMIQMTDFPLHTVHLSAEEVPELAERIAWFEDEPYGGIPTLAYSKIFETARQNGIIVLLDGQGMDEAWAGYDYYTRQSGVLVQGSKSSPVSHDCLRPEFRVLAQKPEFPMPFDNALQNMQYRDLFYTKIPRALRFNDRISMMYSTELREPFLDHRLVELAFSLPAALKIREGQQKWLARQIADTYLSSKVTLAPKRPLQTPQREWLAGNLAAWADEQITSAASLPFFNSTAVHNTWTAYKNGNTDQSFYIWQWISAAALLGG
jgi:asparagine synthase (glutamine-hydrolysing)